MEPVNINISIKLETRLSKLSESDRVRHIHKVRKIADKIHKAKVSDSHILLVKTLGYSSKIIKKMVKEVAPAITISVMKIAPALLAILL
ncbi:MAG: hypothetical protein PVF17_00555 [Ignavibacteria bacterium]|jgi:hypothetical protein